MGLLSTIHSFVHSHLLGLANSCFIWGVSPTAIMVTWMLALPRCLDTQQRARRKGGCSIGDTNDRWLAYDMVAEMRDRQSGAGSPGKAASGKTKWTGSPTE